MSRIELGLNDTLLLMIVMKGIETSMLLSDVNLIQYNENIILPLSSKVGVNLIVINCMWIVSRESITSSPTISSSYFVNFFEIGSEDPLIEHIFISCCCCWKWQREGN